MPPKSAEEQQRILATFREQCLAEGIIKPESEAAHDDNLLLRFLRARQYNLSASKVMLQKCEDWRGSVGGVGMEQLYKDIDPFEYPERNAVFQHWPLYFHKTDKKGRPINIHKFGSINASELMKQVTPERFMDILTVNCEALTREVLPACSKAAGKQVETVLVIVDLQGFGISQFWSMKDLVRTSFQISQDYYPETMGQVAIINAPMTFTTMWSAIKPWLARETVEKVDILGSDYRDALLRLADPSALPKELGGECTCADHGGDCAKSNVGPWMEGRVERRAAWIRGDRRSTAIDETEDAHIEPDASPPKSSLGTGTAGPAAAPDAALEAAAGRELPISAEGSPRGTPTGERTHSPATVPPGVATDYAQVERDSQAHGPPAAAPAPVGASEAPADAADVERTPVPPAAAPAGYAPPLSPPVELDVDAEAPVSLDGSADSPLPPPRISLSSTHSSTSGVEPRTPASVRSAVSHKSGKSRRSVLSGVFGRRSQSKASHRSSRVVSDVSDDSDQEDAGAGRGVRRSRLRATVEKVLDKIHGDGKGAR